MRGREDAHECFRPSARYQPSILLFPTRVRQVGGLGKEEDALVKMHKQGTKSIWVWWKGCCSFGRFHSSALCPYGEGYQCSNLVPPSRKVLLARGVPFSCDRAPMERGITAVTWFPRHHVRRHLLHGFGSCLLRIAVPRRAPRDAVRAWVLRRVLASGGAIGMSHPGDGRRGEEGARLALLMPRRGDGG